MSAETENFLATLLRQEYSNGDLALLKRKDRNEELTLGTKLFLISFGKYFTVFTMLDSEGGFLPYSRVTSRETGLMTMMHDTPNMTKFVHSSNHHSSITG